MILELVIIQVILDNVLVLKTLAVFICIQRTVYESVNAPMRRGYAGIIVCVGVWLCV